MEILITGCVSFAVTIVNIIAITLTGWAILRLKEVTPEKIPQQFSSFWRKDVKLHREHVNTVKDKNQTIVEEAREVLGVRKTSDGNLEKTFVDTIFHKVKQDGEYINIKSGIQRLYSTPAIKIQPMETIKENEYLSNSMTTQRSVHEFWDKSLHNQAKMIMRESLQNLQTQHDRNQRDTYFTNLRKENVPRSA